MYSVTGEKESRGCLIWEMQNTTNEFSREVDDYLDIWKRMRENQNCLRDEIYLSVTSSSKKRNGSLLIGIKNDKGRALKM